MVADSFISRAARNGIEKILREMGVDLARCLFGFVASVCEGGPCLVSKRYPAGGAEGVTELFYFDEVEKKKSLFG